MRAWCGALGCSAQREEEKEDTVTGLYDGMFAMVEEIDYRVNLGEEQTLDDQRKRILSTVEMLVSHHSQTITQVVSQLRIKNASIWLYAAPPSPGWIAQSPITKMRFKFGLHVYFGSLTSFETHLSTPAGGSQTKQQNDDRMYICGFLRRE